MSEKNRRNCPWGYSCTKKWEDLIATSEEDVRFCTDCQKEVYWVRNKEQLAENVLLNRCVNFSSQLIDPHVADEGSAQEIEESSVLMGLVVPTDYELENEGNPHDRRCDFDDDIGN